jgi:O-antigen/teichoic acid export membrane protein
MTRTRRLLGGASLGYVHQAAIIVAGLWLTPFLLQRLGQHDLGLWLVAGQLLGYLGLLDLGVIALLPREVASASGHDPDRRQSGIAAVVSAARTIVRMQLPLFALACGLTLWLLPRVWESLGPPLAIVLVSFVALYPLRISTAALQGLQELPFVGGVQLAGWVLGTALTVGLIWAGAGLYALVVGWVAGQAVPALAAWRRMRGSFPSLIAAGAMPRGSGLKSYFQRSIWVSVGQAAQVLLAGTDVLVLGMILGPAAVVPYACTGKLVTVFANHPQLLMQAAQPALSELRARASRDRLSNAATALSQAMLLMSGGLAVLVLAVNQQFVGWWVGDTQFGGWPLSVAFVVMMLLRHWNVTALYTLFSFGHERRISLTSLVDGAVTVLVGIVLVSVWGPIGAPLASILGVVLVSLPLNVRAVSRELNGTIADSIEPPLQVLTRIVPVASAAGVAGYWWPGGSLEGLALIGGSSILLYALVALPLTRSGPVAPYLASLMPAFAAGSRRKAALEHEPAPR